MQSTPFSQQLPLQLSMTTLILNCIVASGLWFYPQYLTNNNNIPSA